MATGTPIYILALAGVSMVLILTGAFSSVRASRVGGRVGQRLNRYTGTRVSKRASLVALPKSDALADRLEKVVTRRSFAQSIKSSLQQADLKLRVSEYLVLWFVSTGLGAVLSWFIFRQSIVFAFGGLVAGFLLPRYLVRFWALRRLRNYNNQLGDTLNLWVNVLRSGYSVLQAMETIAAESAPPVSTEFERVVQEVRLGLKLEEALANLLMRVPSDDMDLVVTAVNIQREVGGNLAEVLATISHTIRERIRIKGEIAVLTAQATISGMIISLLPIALTLFLRASNPEYINELFYRESPWVFPGVIPCGWLVVAFGLLLIFTGYLAMRKIADIEI